MVGVGSVMVLCGWSAGSQGKCGERRGWRQDENPFERPRALHRRVDSDPEDERKALEVFGLL